MALVVFSRTQRHPAAAAEACAQYAKLLRHAQLTLSSLVETNIDAALLAVFLMARYEDSAQGEEAFLPNPSFNSYLHHDGAAAILKIWRSRHAGQNQRATSTVKYSRRGIIRSALLRYLAVPAWLEDGRVFGEGGRDLEYDGILVQIANLRNQLKALQQNSSQLDTISPELFQMAQKLCNEAERLDSALQDWAIRIPSSWYPYRHLIRTGSSLPPRHFFSTEVYSYSSMTCAARWLNYSATRTLLNRAWLKILELVQPCSDDSAHNHSVEQCRSRILVAANDVSSSIPFVHGTFKATDAGKHQTVITLNTDAEIEPYVASLTAWPLSIASSIGSLNAGQKQWFGSQLALIGRILGSGVLERVGAADLLDL
ncbi:uncharacterized protein Z520_10323 [Fonsecaea multimorphosa CBS 102226]|uniref:Uncharacterized protein n=1 Tax=Fonsecaea multimorphosa CBS 102226 TaxID=1442371 RepID=A0A0D2IA05_9EURO|nr:uncharacterized protein Z520_10323 [Fonsecaea multimorphosa CBS 102226]KIX93986.1 hypothetical protein Z520_10323 [Fonsecaea multimorphosa CBS 102226]